jgi:hypothetical protein
VRKKVGSRAGELRLSYANPPHYKFFQVQWYEEFAVHILFPYVSIMEQHCGIVVQCRLYIGGCEMMV